MSIHREVSPWARIFFSRTDSGVYIRLWRARAALGASGSTTSPQKIGIIKFMNFLLSIFDNPGGTTSVTGVRDTIFPMRHTDEAKHHIAVNQKLSRPREILTSLRLNFVLLTCASAVHCICSVSIRLVIRRQYQNCSMLITSLSHSLPADGAVVAPAK